MLSFTIPEYGRIPLRQIPPRALKRLRALDEDRARRPLRDDGGTETVFDWSLREHLRAKSYVGVIQVPGLSIEILPKVDVEWGSRDTFETKERARSQKNLLYMLAVGGSLPIKERDLASLHTKDARFLEVLMRLFAERLLGELRRGADHAYVRREENVSLLRGRILFSEHIRRNLAHAERLYVERDEFDIDTPLNRVLKAACRALLRVTRSAWTARCLHEALVHFGEVSDQEIRGHDLDAVTLHRNNERYETLLELAKLILRHETPAPEQGAAEAFSLLFPMEVVFERFIGAFIKKHAASFGFEPSEVHLQARGHSKCLLRSAHDGAGHFRLKPDILIGDATHPKLIVDTKWKRLLPDDRDRRNGVSQADIYQLFAYAERFDCDRNILLFPHAGGATRKHYSSDGSRTRSISTSLVDVSSDLARGRDDFLRQLGETFGAPV